MTQRMSLLLLASLALASPAVAASVDQNRLFTNSKLVSSDRISIEVIGKGPDVILIPGLASSRQVWQRTADRLKNHNRLHIIQVAGFAGDPPRANVTGPVVAPTIDAIASYISTARLNRPAIVGHSLGGLMALQLAADHPASVGKVFVVDALPFYAEIFAGPSATSAAVKPIADGLGAKMLTLSDGEFAKNAAQTASMLVTSKDDQARVGSWSTASTRQTMVTAMQEDLTTDFRSRISAIEAPVTVIYEASLKPLVDQDYGRLKHGTLIAEPAGVKHFVMYDDPTGFDKALDTFLASPK